MRIFFVAPDYHEDRPKKCVNGWGSMFLTITPDGTALPCHTARMLPGLAFPNVRDTACARSGSSPTASTAIRGTGWMKEPCRQLREREQDLGGCRCQAYLLAGDPPAADPVCDKSPHHGVVEEAVRVAQRPVSDRSEVHPLVFRDPKESRRRASQSTLSDFDSGSISTWLP